MNESSPRAARLVSVISVAVFAALTVFLTLTVGRRIAALAGDGPAFREWIASKGFAGKLIYVGIVFLQIVISLIPGEPVEIGGGYAFGAWQGLLLAEIGIILASAFVFVFVRKLGAKAVYAFVPKDKVESLAFLRDSRRRDLMVFLLFFIPGTPKDVLTYFIGLTPMKFGEWLLITTAARVPSVLTSTLAGAAAGQQDYRLALVIFAATAVVSLFGIFAYRRIIRRENARIK